MKNLNCFFNCKGFNCANSTQSSCWLWKNNFSLFLNICFLHCRAISVLSAVCIRASQIQSHAALIHWSPCTGQYWYALSLNLVTALKYCFLWCHLSLPVGTECELSNFSPLKRRLVPGHGVTAEYPQAYFKKQDWMLPGNDCIYSCWFFVCWFFPSCLASSISIRLHALLYPVQ